MSWFDSSSMMQKRETLKQNVVCMKYMTGISSKNYHLGYAILIGWPDLMERIWKYFMIFSLSQKGMLKIRTDCVSFGKMLAVWLKDIGKVQEIVQVEIGNWFCIDWQPRIRRSIIQPPSAFIWNDQRGKVTSNIGSNSRYLYCVVWMIPINNMELNILTVNWPHWTQSKRNWTRKTSPMMILIGRCLTHLFYSSSIIASSNNYRRCFSLQAWLGIIWIGKDGGIRTVIHRFWQEYNGSCESSCLNRQFRKMSVIIDSNYTKMILFNASTWIITNIWWKERLIRIIKYIHYWTMEWKHRLIWLQEVESTDHRIARSYI